MNQWMNWNNIIKERKSYVGVNEDTVNILSLEILLICLKFSIVIHSASPILLTP